jgi:hypothetical protein
VLDRCNGLMTCSSKYCVKFFPVAASMAYDKRTKDIEEYAGRSPGVVTGAVFLSPARSSTATVRARPLKLYWKLTLLVASFAHAQDSTLWEVAI